MAGIYFHIPFCKTRCMYCDFFSTITNDQLAMTNYVNALCQELQQRKDYLQNQPIETIYFGGGTPSQLPPAAFEKIFIALSSVMLNNHAPVMSTGAEWALARSAKWRHLMPTSTIEITLEANPDDLTDAYLESISHLPFNRLSIGIQSFDDKELRFLNRRHTAQEAIQAVERAQKYGFDNISIDLMYGLPNQTLETWQATLNQAIKLGVQHISAYHLIYEEGTALHQLLEQGKIAPVDEDTSIELFEMLIDTLAAAGFQQYEISNFAQPGYESRHNSAYWSGKHYLGIGASAHSYNGVSRQWNSYQLPVTSYQLPVTSYQLPVTKCHSHAGGKQRSAVANPLHYAPEIEMIDEKTAYNDFIITRLRTMKGINLDELVALFGEKQKTNCLLQAQRSLDRGLLTISDNHLRLTRAGIFISDTLMTDLMR
ncbi:MAG: radical SAM family heme chaperone HemW [Candidatus Symbiothrix sp.]|jgi:oxygen-independent coproporphyrinogen-3 oxidase|nr:radical SAM family heme chaperone HemW [Candidatus Symbiothrix sp.]